MVLGLATAVSAIVFVVLGDVYWRRPPPWP